MALEDYKGVFIYAQQVDGELSGIALELLGKARALAEDLDEKKVTAVLLGSDVKGLTGTLAEYGADRVIRIPTRWLPSSMSTSRRSCWWAQPPSAVIWVPVSPPVYIRV